MPPVVSVKFLQKKKAPGKRYKLEPITAGGQVAGAVDEYRVGDAAVCITEEGLYLISEPPVSDEAADLYDLIIRHIDIGEEFDLGADLKEEAMADKLEASFWKVAEKEQRLGDAKRLFPRLRYYIRRNIVGYGILDVMMRDELIEDILCSAPGRPIRVIHRVHSGRFHTLRSNVMYRDVAEMERFIQRVYGRTASEPTESRPMSVTDMPDGSRISSTFGRQISKPRPVIAIRKFPARPLTITHLLRSGTLSAEMAAYLWTLLDAKAVGLIIGVTGSGKTTLISTLASMLHPRWRILTMEETLELQIPHQDWVRLKTRKSYGMLGEKFNVTMRSLIDLSLTQRPDFAIVGEIRVSDMDALFQAVGTGHGGLTSFHASSAQGALTRMRGNRIEEGELALLWFTLHTAGVRRKDRYARKVKAISETMQDARGKVGARCIYRYDIASDTFKRQMPLSKSKRYVEALDVCGIPNPEADLKRRISLLRECVETESYTVPEVFGIIGRYYG